MQNLTEVENELCNIHVGNLQWGSVWVHVLRVICYQIDVKDKKWIIEFLREKRLLLRE